MNNLINIVFNKKEVNGQNWRWLIVLVFPPIFALIASSMVFILNFIQIYIFSNSNIWIFDHIVPIAASGVAAWVFIYSAYHIAPKRKIQACRTFTAVFGLLAIFASLSTFLHALPQPEEWKSVMRTWTIFLTMVVTTVHLTKMPK